MDESYLDEMIVAYVEAAIWVGLDWDHCDQFAEHEEKGCTRECVENGNPAALDELYSAEDLSKRARVDARVDCEAFVTAAGEDLSEWSAGQAGHDFYLTRNGHGTGFWDRGLEAGGRLSDAAKVYGTSELSAGSDKKLYWGG